MRTAFLALAILQFWAVQPACGIVQIFNNQADFAAATSATNATGPLPNLWNVAGPTKIGSVNFSRLAGARRFFFGGNNLDHTTRLPGHELALDGSENFAVDFDHPVYAAGFAMVEPRLDPNLTAPFVDSTFSITLKNGAAIVGAIQFAPPNDAATFCGVRSDRPFTRLEIVEIIGGPDEEFFGEFYVVETPQTVALPVSGLPIPQLAVIDQAMRQFLDDSRYPGVSVAIARDGRLVFERAYGWTDYLHTAPLHHTEPIPVASVSKTITAMAVHRLVRDGLLNTSLPVLEYLGLPPLPGAEFNPQARLITIDHLLAHTSGLPEYRPDNFEVAAALGWSRPASFSETVAYQCALPLLFAPGSASQYSNLGFALLGVVIEKASGLSYGDYLRKIFADEMEAGSIRVPSELQITNAAPQTSLLADTYGNNAAAGGVQIIASDLCRIMRGYRLSGPHKPAAVPGGTFNITFFGSSDGVLSVVRQRFAGGTAIEFAAIANARGTLSNDNLNDAIFDRLLAITDWPSHNYYPSLTWKMDHFWSFPTGRMAAESHFDQDFDHDGISNLAEYAFDLNPKNHDGVAPSPIAAALANGAFQITVPKIPRKPDLHFEILGAADFQTWSPIAWVQHDYPLQIIDPSFATSDPVPADNLKITTPSPSPATSQSFRWRLFLRNLDFGDQLRIRQP